MDRSRSAGLMTALSVPPPTETGPRIQVLHVPGCPNVERILRMVERSLERLELPNTIELIEGPYPSPTVIVNGIEVNPGRHGATASCRLDLPAEEQIIDALAAAHRVPSIPPNRLNSERVGEDTCRRWR